MVIGGQPRHTAQIQIRNFGNHLIVLQLIVVKIGRIVVALRKASAESCVAQTGGGHGLRKHAICKVKPRLQISYKRCPIQTIVLSSVMILFTLAHFE